MLISIYLGTMGWKGTGDEWRTFFSASLELFELHDDVDHFFSKN